MNRSSGDRLSPPYTNKFYFTEQPCKIYFFRPCVICRRRIDTSGVSEAPCTAHLLREEEKLTVSLLSVFIYRKRKPCVGLSLSCLFKGAY